MNVKEYQVMMNQPLTKDQLEYQLNNRAELGWKPILLSTAQAALKDAPVSVTVIFEKEKE
jgi:hypothetical protein